MEYMTKQQIKILLYDLKDGLKNANYPPSYSSDYSIYNNSESFNCYAYTMQFKIQYKYHPWYTPGFLSDSIPNEYTYNNLITAFLNDCKFLGLLYKKSNINSEIGNNKYKIGIMLDRNADCFSGRKDFHFIRQNEDLSWSEMGGRGGSVMLVDNPKKHYRCELLDIIEISKTK